LAQISGKQGMHGEAEAYFYKASELSEDTPEFLYRLVEVIHEYYDYVDVAINLLKKYIALRPNDSKGYNALGFYYIVDGNLKEAQLVLEKSLDIETSSIGLINLSVVKWLMNDIGQAQKSLREALKISGKTHYRKKGNIRRPSVFIEGWINIMLGNKTNGLMIMNETIQKESIWFLHNTEVWSKAVIEKGDSTPDGLTEALEMIQRMINQKKER